MGIILKRKNVEDFKGNKPFEKGDIFIYLSLLIAVVLLFVFLVIIPLSEDKKSIEISVKGKSYFTYSFASDTFNIAPFALPLIDKERVQGGYEVTVYSNDEKTDFNVVFIEVNKQSVSVINASCPNKDCTHMSIKRGSGSIICSPNGFSAFPLKVDGDNVTVG